MRKQTGRPLISEEIVALIQGVIAPGAPNAFEAKSPMPAGTTISVGR